MKNTLNVKLITTAVALYMTVGMAAQEKPFRIGTKIGFPNGVGGHVEYVTPLLGGQLAPSIEYSSMNMDKWLDPDSADFKYIEGGINYYFFKAGRGLYTHLGYGKLDGSYVSDYNGSLYNGPLESETVTVSHSSFNLRLGAKWGGLFCFRPEVGFLLNPLPKTLDTYVEYTDGTVEIEQEEIPKELTSGLTFNIGFGLSF